MFCLGAPVALRFPGRRAFGPPVRSPFDLNLRSTLELRARRGLVELRPRPSLRRRLNLRPLVVLRSRVRRALDRRRRVAAGLVGWLARGRRNWIGWRLSGRLGANLAAGVGPGGLLRVRPGGIGSLWPIWLEAPLAGGEVGRSVHACSLVWPPGGRRAQPIEAEALPRRLSTTWAAPIPPAAVEG
jgi:hypothetical protein